jgi:hypothetical protein
MQAFENVRYGVRSDLLDARYLDVDRLAEVSEAVWSSVGAPAARATTTPAPRTAVLPPSNILVAPNLHRPAIRTERFHDGSAPGMARLFVIVRSRYVPIGSNL